MRPAAVFSLVAATALASPLACSGSGSSGGNPLGDGGSSSDGGSPPDGGTSDVGGPRTDGAPTDGRVPEGGSSDSPTPSDGPAGMDSAAAPDVDGGALCANAPPPQSGGTTYYVSPSGSDSNPGTQALPFLTIQQAANVVNPGDTVLVLDGTYSNAAGGSIVDVARGGTSGNWVWFKSANRWGAKLDGMNNTDTTGWHLSTDASNNPVGFVRIEGFEIMGEGIGTLCGGCSNGGADAIDAYAGGHDVQIIGNHIHDIGRLCTDTSNGEVGVFVQQPNVTIEQNLFHDIGRFGDQENGCAQDNAYWQNHDHAIYVDGSTDSSAPGASNTMIRNNIFYNNTHGWGVQLYPGNLPGISILNNTFAFPNPNKDGHIVAGANFTDLTVENNVFYQPTTSMIAADTATFASSVISHNLTTAAATLDVATPAGVTIDTSTLNTDPSFANPSAFDFRLQPGSPALAAGLSLPNVLVDFDGCPRPTGSPYDLGAYQH